MAVRPTTAAYLADLEPHIRELNCMGLTVIPPEMVGPRPSVEGLRDAVRKVAERRTIRHASDSVATGRQLFYLLFEEAEFQQAVMNPTVLALVDSILGEAAILSSCNAWIKGPGAAPLPLHADQKVQPIPLSLGFNITYVLSEYGREQGGLCFVPGSHKQMRQPTSAENFTSRGGGSLSAALAAAENGEVVQFEDPPNAVPVEASAGSIVAWHGNTWHGAYPRRSSGIRMNLILYFCSPWLRTHENYGDFASEEVIQRNGPRFRTLIGGDVILGWTEAGPGPAGEAFKRRRAAARRRSAQIHLQQ